MCGGECDPPRKVKNLYYEMECRAKSLSRSPAGIPAGSGYVKSFPVVRACDLECIPDGTPNVSPGQGTLCKFKAYSIFFLLYFYPRFFVGDG